MGESWYEGAIDLRRAVLVPSNGGNGLMAAQVVIISLWAMFVWFRFMISVTLSARRSKDFGAAVASEHGLSYPRVHADEGESALALLARDYSTLKRLLKANVGGVMLEDRLLMIDYRLMIFWHRMVAPFSPVHARAAAAEMLNIVIYLANAVGERSV